MRHLTIWALLAILLLGCSSDSDVRRVRVFEVNVVSKDGKGYVGPGLIYSVGMVTQDGEQMWMMSSHKLAPGYDICVTWVSGSGWCPTPCGPSQSWSANYEVEISTRMAPPRRK